jgi:uncharacterized protein YcnI
MLKTSLLALAAALLALPAVAHITLEQAEAVAGSAYKAVLRVGHGCDGSPTTRLTVTLPAGFRGAKPIPKAGWSLDIKREKLATPYDSHGRQISEDVVEVSWAAKSEDAYLQDTWYDEFVVRGSLPEQAGPIWFKVHQRCVKGEWSWADMPAEGDSTKGLKAPAVRLMLLKPAATPGTHQH